jgi:hypothetical protein
MSYNVQLDPSTGLPIIPKDWLTVNNSPGSWNEGLGRDVYLQNAGFSPEAFAALEQAGFGNGSNYQWGFGSDQGLWQQDSSMGTLTNPTLTGVMQKTADKEGTKYTYQLDANGNYVPVATGQTQHWDTNNGDMNTKALIAMASVLAGGMAANYGMTGNMLTAAAPTGMGNLGVESILGSALTDGVGAFGAATPEITAEMLAGANATSDPIAYLNAQAGWTAPDPAYLATLTTVPPGTVTPGYTEPPPWPTDTTPPPPATTTPPGGPPAPPKPPADLSKIVKPVTDAITGGNNSGSSTNSNKGWTDLLSLFLTAMGGDRQEDFADSLLAMYNDQNELAKPWRQRLDDSYTPEGQQSILSSPEFTSQQGLYKQMLDRRAGKAGALTNTMTGLEGVAPRGREAAMQKFGFDYLNDYRKPITSMVDLYTKNAADYKLLAAMGLGTEAAAPANWQNYISRNGGIDGILNTVNTVIDAGGSIWDWWNGLDFSSDSSGAPDLTDLGDLSGFDG